MDRNDHPRLASRRRSSVAFMIGLSVILAVGAASARHAAACSIDGLPSLSVDGRVVTANTTLAGDTPGAFESWTPFVIALPHATHRRLVLREDTVKLATALVPAAFRYPWRWQLGDGTTVRGSVVYHRYRHPGHYIVTVDAYLVAGTQRQWFTFDRATITIG